MKMTLNGKKKLFFLTINFILQPIPAMEIVTYYEHEFADNAAYYEKPMLTETVSFQLLKDNPLTTKITFLAVPWYAACKEKKKFIDRIPSVCHKDCFTVTHVARYDQLLPKMRSMGVSVLFASHATKADAYKKKNGILIVPFPHYPMNPADPAEIKDILYSFIGADTFAVRKKLFGMKHPKNTYVKKRVTWHYNKSKELMAEEYRDVLARSRFSLCPRGYGPTTLRFWESLQAGAIPVVLSDQMTLPGGFEWKNCVIQISEKDVNRIPELLAKISPEKELWMRQQCLQAHKKFSGECFVDPIRRFFGELQDEFTHQERTFSQKLDLIDVSESFGLGLRRFDAAGYFYKLYTAVSNYIRSSC